MKKLLFLSLFILTICSQDYIQGEPCIQLKGIYSPINILNVNLDQLFLSLDPINENSSVEVLDILFDNQTERFKFIFKIGKLNEKPYYIGILSLLEKSGVDKFTQKILKTVQSDEFGDIQSVLFYSKSPQDSQLKCPQLKKHFYQELRDQLGLTFLNRYKDYRQDTNESIPDPRLAIDLDDLSQDIQPSTQTSQQTQERNEMPKTVEEVYQTTKPTRYKRVQYNLQCLSK